MLKVALTWLVMTIGQQGPIATDIKDPTPFTSKEECEKFGEEMSPRMGDWVRGAIRAPWSHPVEVVFNCDAEGNPA